MDSTEPRYDLGVLFVHGIGEQKPADTLLAFGGPLCEWLDHWLSADDRKEVTGQALLDRARLNAPLLPDGEPANAELRLVFDKGTGRDNQTWLLAESCWSSQFVTPSITQFLGWLVTRGPWVVLLHWHQRAFRPERPVWLAWLHRRVRLIGPQRPAWLQLILGLLVFAIWFGISLLLAFTWTVVSLIALIPIGRLRDSVYSGLRKMTGIVGDSYVFVREPIQRAAAVEATLSALQWVRSRSRKVAVIAHSQGAAVAHRTLRLGAAPQVERFITFGEGLGKLQALTLAESRFSGSLICAGLAAPLLAVAAIWFVRLHQLGLEKFSYEFAPSIVLIVGLACLGTAWSAIKHVLDALQTRGNVLTMRNVQHAMKWRDFYASHDPVPNGPLSRSILLPEVRGRVVIVLQSLLADHTEYWRSKADFIPSLVRQLDRLAGSQLFREIRAAHAIRDARRVDAVRVRALTWVRKTHALALALPVAFAWPRLIELGALLRKMLAGSPFSFSSDAMDKVDSALGWLSSSVFATTLRDPAMITDPVVTFALMCVALFVWQRVYSVIWTWWRDLALEPLFTPSDLTFATGRWDGRTLAGLCMLLGCLPLILSIAWVFFPDMVAETTIYRVVALLLAMLTTGFMMLVLRMMLVEAWGKVVNAVRTGGDYDVQIRDFAFTILSVVVAVGVLTAALGVLPFDLVMQLAVALLFPIWFVTGYASLAKRIQVSTAPRWLRLLVAIVPVMTLVVSVATLNMTSQSIAENGIWRGGIVPAAVLGLIVIWPCRKVLGRYVPPPPAPPAA